MKPDFAALIKNFQFKGDFLDASPHGFGHINDTYAVSFRQVNGLIHRYILQRINHDVFNKPEEMMQNIERVTSHLREKITAAGGNPDRETINLIPTQDEKSFYRTPEGNYWRAMVFIEGAQTYQKAERMGHYYNASKAFGKFLSMLSDFPPGHLYVTIPDFHHTGKRFEAVVEAVDRDVKNRAVSVKPEIGFILDRAEETTVLVDLLEGGKLPERVTHNDTKFDNVMIDGETGEGVCVIDLDTVMPGLCLYDFGDSVRYGANPAAEDERDLSKVYFDLEVFDRYAQGYLDATGDILTPTEVDYLPFSVKLITFEQGMRFLTDHLNGDVYYKIHRKDHNLDRCRTQFKMVSDIDEKFLQMVKIIERSAA